MNQEKIDSHISHDLGHGRGEKREMWVSENLRFIEASTDWMGMKSIVCVEPTRWINGNTQSDKRLYISSLSGKSPQQMGEYVRKHWGIENHTWILPLTKMDVAVERIMPQETFLQ